MSQANPGNFLQLLHGHVQDRHRLPVARLVHLGDEARHLHRPGRRRGPGVADDLVALLEAAVAEVLGGGDRGEGVALQMHPEDGSGE